jgi:uncharacterized protein (DUF1697 family)
MPRGLAERAGGTDVRSVIATGNLLFRSDKAPRALERDLEAACEALYGRATEMVVKNAEEWRSLLAANPFPEEARAAPSRLLVWAMRTPLPDGGLDQLRRRARGAERIERTAEGDLYVWFGEGPISARRSRPASAEGARRRRDEPQLEHRREDHACPGRDGGLMPRSCRIDGPDPRRQNARRASVA